MKKIHSLKLTQLSKADLEARQMNVLRGGGTPGDCSCGCHYASSGGSSNCTNGNTNYRYGYSSYGGGTRPCDCLFASDNCREDAFYEGR